MGERDSAAPPYGKTPMKTSIAAALAGLAMASTPTLGADLFGTAPPPMTFQPGQAPLTEVGANWYLRGDLGLDLDQAASFSMAGDFDADRRPGFLPYSTLARIVAAARRPLAPTSESATATITGCDSRAPTSIARPPPARTPTACFAQPRRRRSEPPAISMTLPEPTLPSAPAHSTLIVATPRRSPPPISISATTGASRPTLAAASA